MLNIILGTSIVQKVLAKAQLYALKGMNYANNGDYARSGEISVLKFIHKKSADSNQIIFDAGANKGGYTLAIRSIFKDKAQIHAFEPSAKTLLLLKENTKALTNLIINNFGLGEEEGELTLYSNADGSALASVYDRSRIVLDQKETIHISTVDDYCTKQNINHILFLKIDVEGHELSVLKGAKSMLSNKKIRYIQFECGGTSIDSRIYFKDYFDLLSDNYRIYRILKKGLFEIKRYNEQNEVFLNVNYLAELK